MVGISCDSAWCHRAFARDRRVRFPLLSDFEPKGAAARVFRNFPLVQVHPHAVRGVSPSP